jgi:hypothetical protein
MRQLGVLEMVSWIASATEAYASCPNVRRRVGVRFRSCALPPTHLVVVLLLILPCLTTRVWAAPEPATSGISLEPPVTVDWERTQHFRLALTPVITPDIGGGVFAGVRITRGWWVDLEWRRAYPLLEDHKGALGTFGPRIAYRTMVEGVSAGARLGFYSMWCDTRMTQDETEYGCSLAVSPGAEVSLVRTRSFFLGASLELPIYLERSRSPYISRDDPEGEWSSREIAVLGVLQLMVGFVR